MQIQRDITVLLPSGKIADLQHHLFAGLSSRRIQLADLPPHHVTDDLGRADARKFSRVGAASISQDRNAVRDQGELFHAVRDVNHAHSLGAEVPDDPKQLLAFLLREH